MWLNVAIEEQHLTVKIRRPEIAVDSYSVFFVDDRMAPLLTIYVVKTTVWQNRILDKLGPDLLLFGSCSIFCGLIFLLLFILPLVLRPLL